MADYHPLITRAVEGLSNNTAEARRTLYERARAALVAQLRGIDPPLSEAEITRERLALEDSIRKVELGDVSGQMRITLMKYPGAVSYEVHWAPEVSIGNPSTWARQPVAHRRPPTTISGLTPGTTYVFQVRALTKTGYSDWSDSVTRMAV